MINSIFGLVTTAQSLGVNDLTATLRLVTQEDPTPESLLLKDLILHPRTRHLVGRWFGGAHTAARLLSDLLWERPPPGSGTLNRAGEPEELAGAAVQDDNLGRGVDH